MLQWVNLTVEGDEVVAQLGITLGMEPTRELCVKDAGRERVSLVQVLVTIATVSPL